MGKKSNPVLIGGFVVGAFALLVVFVFLLSGGFLSASTKKFVTYFDGSVSGLTVGADVQFQGVKIGSVSDVSVIYQREERSLVVPVVLEIDFNRIVHGNSDAVLTDFEFMDYFFEKGLRAQLQTKSLVTGQLMVGLAFFPDTKPVIRNLDDKYIEIPAVPSTIESIAQTIEELSLDQIVGDLHLLIRNFDSLVNSKTLKNTIASIDVAAKSLDKLIRDVDLQVAPMALEARGTLAEIRKTAAALNDEMGPLAGDVRTTLREVRNLTSHVDGEVGAVASRLSGAAADAGTLIRNLDRSLPPLTANINETVMALKGSLAKADTALGAVGRLAQEDSPLYYHLTRTLKDLSGASRDISVFADYLQRNPDALIFGKKEK